MLLGVGALKLLGGAKEVVGEALGDGREGVLAVFIVVHGSRDCVCSSLFLESWFLGVFYCARYQDAT